MIHSIQRQRSRARRGFSIVEVAIAAMVLSVGLVGAAVMGIRCGQLQQSTQDYVAAHNAARDVVEQLRNGDLALRFQELSAAPNFNVGDLAVQVTFPANVLTQSLGGAPPATARFRDMDADGDIDFDAASDDAGSLLPVQVIVQRAGLRFQFVSLVSDR